MYIVWTVDEQRRFKGRDLVTDRRTSKKEFEEHGLSKCGNYLM
jgi:hypothetical protein